MNDQQAACDLTGIAAAFYLRGAMTDREREEKFLQEMDELQKKYGFMIVADFGRIEKFEGANTKLEIQPILRSKPLPGWKPPESEPIAPLAKLDSAVEPITDTFPKKG